MDQSDRFPGPRHPISDTWGETRDRTQPSWEGTEGERGWRDVDDVGRYVASHGGRGRTDRTRTVAFLPSDAVVPSVAIVHVRRGGPPPIVRIHPFPKGTLPVLFPHRTESHRTVSRVCPPFRTRSVASPLRGPSALNSRLNKDTSLSFSDDPVRLPSKLTSPGRPRGYFPGELFAFLSALPRFRS